MTYTHSTLKLPCTVHSHRDLAHNHWCYVHKWSHYSLVHTHNGNHRFHPVEIIQTSDNTWWQRITFYTDMIWRCWSIQYWCILTWQVPPFMHGCGAHSSLSDWHRSPKYPDGHVHWNPLTWSCLQSMKQNNQFNTRNSKPFHMQIYINWLLIYSLGMVHIGP